MVGVDRQRKERSVYRIEKALRIFSVFHPERCHRRSPSHCGKRGRQPCFSALQRRTGSQNRGISGTHLCRRNAGWRPARNSFHSRSFQNVAEADILREEAGDRGGGVAFKRRKQRNAALGSHHAGDGVIGTRKLGGVAEIESFVLVCRVRASGRERRRYQNRCVRGFPRRYRPVQLRVRNALRRLFVIGDKIGSPSRDCDLTSSLI